jgi:5'(3')-deoxyribonucleotidase
MTLKVGVDLDGVCYSFDDSLRLSLVVNRGYNPEACPPSTRWEFYEDWGLSLAEFLSAFAEGVDTGIIFAQGDAYPGTREALQRMIDAGHELHVITDRTVGTPGIAEGATARWIAEHLPTMKSLTFSRDKTVVPTDMMIDDKPANYHALEAAGCDAWLFNRPWNQSATEITKRVNSLDEFADMVINYSRKFVTV